jgi:GxxExxY protein
VLELVARGMEVQRQVTIPITYKGHSIHNCCVDLVVDGQLVVEVKAVERIVEVHRAQCRSYLRAGDCELGLVLNFNVRALRDGIVRVINIV